MKGWKDVGTEDVQRWPGIVHGRGTRQIARSRSLATFYPFNATLQPSFFTVSRPTTPFYQRRRRLTRRRPDRIYFDVARADAIRLTRPIFRSRYGRILKGMRGGSTTKHFFSRFHRDGSKVRCNESQHAN